jgi:hypothetical protein
LSELESGRESIKIVNEIVVGFRVRSREMDPRGVGFE